MVKTLHEPGTPIIDIQFPASNIRAPSATQEENRPPPSGRVFRDKLYTSRTLVMSDGSTLSVKKGRVVAHAEDQHLFLSNHPDFEALQE